MLNKSWTTDEIRMLEFAVNTYLKRKSITENDLTTYDWDSIANLVPGRTETQ